MKRLHLKGEDKPAEPAGSAVAVAVVEAAVAAEAVAATGSAFEGHTRDSYMSLQLVNSVVSQDLLLTYSCSHHDIPCTIVTDCIVV